MRLHICTAAFPPKSGEAFLALFDSCGMYSHVENTVFLVSVSLAHKIKADHNQFSENLNVHLRFTTYGRKLALISAMQSH